MGIYRLDIQKIQKAFSPAQEIEEPELFVGRREEIISGMMALSNTGSLLCVFGLRGVGKSSIAHQLALIAAGNSKLPEMISMERYLPRRGFDYLVHYICCDDYVQNIGDLVKRILFGDDRNPSLFSLTSIGEHRLESYTKVFSTQAEASASAVLGAKMGGTKTKESTYKAVFSNDQIQQFRKLLSSVQSNNEKKTGLLILVDEFDRIPDKRGFSSLVKACSGGFVKFGVVGIANSATELVEDHESISRQIDIIHVPRMPKYDLKRIMARAEYRVNRAITFDDDVQENIAEKAEGFPYFVHLLGREAMLLAFMANQPTVNEKVLQVLTEKISEGRLATLYEDTYQRVVKNSVNRELALKALAEVDDDEIEVKRIHKMLKEIGVNVNERVEQLR